MKIAFLTVTRPNEGCDFDTGIIVDYLPIDKDELRSNVRYYIRSLTYKKDKLVTIFSVPCYGSYEEALENTSEKELEPIEIDVWGDRKFITGDYIENADILESVEIDNHANVYENGNLIEFDEYDFFG